MSKIVLSGNEPPSQDPEVVQPMGLPPLRKFAVSRYLGQRDPEIVCGHALEVFGSEGLAIVEYKQIGEGVIQTYPRIFNVWTDLVELTADAKRLN